jgi:hypothetical protein
MPTNQDDTTARAAVGRFPYAHRNLAGIYASQREAAAYAVVRIATHIKAIVDPCALCFERGGCVRRCCPMRQAA